MSRAVAAAVSPFACVLPVYSENTFVLRFFIPSSSPATDPVNWSSPCGWCQDTWKFRVLITLKGSAVPGKKSAVSGQSQIPNSHIMLATGRKLSPITVRSTGCTLVSAQSFFTVQC